MKKIISLLMAVIFAFSMAVPSLAAAETTVAQTEAAGEDVINEVGGSLDGIVDALDNIINSIIEFFKSLFGLGEQPGAYTVTYYYDESKTSEYCVKSYDEGEEIGYVAIPEKEGYTFKGWSPAVPDVMPDEDIEVYATWSLKTYTVTFESGVVDADFEPVTVTHGTWITLPYATNVKNYVLEGWRISEEESEKPGESYYVTSDITFTAEWSEKITIITFDTDGGRWENGKTADYLIEAEVGTAVKAPKAPTKEGYEFIGWDGIVPAKQPTEDVTFTAVWVEAK